MSEKIRHAKNGGSRLVLAFITLAALCAVSAGLSLYGGGAAGGAPAPVSAAAFTVPLPDADYTFTITRSGDVFTAAWTGTALTGTYADGDFSALILHRRGDGDGVGRRGGSARQKACL